MMTYRMEAVYNLSTVQSGTTFHLFSAQDQIRYDKKHDIVTHRTSGAVSQPRLSPWKCLGYIISGLLHALCTKDIFFVFSINKMPIYLNHSSCYCSLLQSKVYCFFILFVFFLPCTWRTCFYLLLQLSTRNTRSKSQFAA
ncbi:hypothetical protein BJV82DRAFT_621212 [Fennellomyces sp. T-0311]|nr:hypothetical protein BJV82DRAFT_621212 [Fennellomyces sp. T-0311]